MAVTLPLNVKAEPIRPPPLLSGATTRPDICPGDLSASNGFVVAVKEELGNVYSAALPTISETVLLANAIKMFGSQVDDSANRIFQLGTHRYYLLSYIDRLFRRCIVFERGGELPVPPPFTA